MFPLKIITPRNFILDAFWFGTDKPEKVIIAIHGLTSNLFSDMRYLPLVSKDTSVVVFNNRGHDIISKLKKLNPESPKGYDSLRCGTAHEVFEECEDDIAGVVAFVKSKGIKNIYLVGHSTGCQKVVYYLSKNNNQKNIRGVVLICPVSDFAYIAANRDKSTYKKALSFARKQVKAGKSNVLIPGSLWPDALIDAQRFLSLYTAESSEEIFTYASNKKPATYKSVKIPLLAIFAGEDEYADRPPKQLEQWFKSNSESREIKTVVIPSAPHNLNGFEANLNTNIKKFISG